jgi:hypothetical protein
MKTCSSLRIVVSGNGHLYVSRGSPPADLCLVSGDYMSINMYCTEKRLIFYIYFLLILPLLQCIENH